MSQSISERGDKVGYSSGVASLLMTEFSCLRCAPACSPGILRRVLLPSAAKKKGLHFSRLRLTLTSHVIFIKIQVNYGVKWARFRCHLASATLWHEAPRILRWVLLPSAAKKKGLHFSRLHLTLTCHVILVISRCSDL